MFNISRCLSHPSPFHFLGLLPSCPCGYSSLRLTTTPPIHKAPNGTRNPLLKPPFRPIWCQRHEPVIDPGQRGQCRQRRAILINCFTSKPINEETPMSNLSTHNRALGHPRE
ncbi:hypothetical protein ABVK25_000647 [Lepraria finkii]|uniref:Uncharacterized protein n=1 Tax=Lepraria finkii TaxID=1340010 RepID=A0ABR4BNQ7_9LECA